MKKNWDITILQIVILAVGVLVLVLGVLSPHFVNGVWQPRFEIHPGNLMFVLGFEVMFLFIALGLEMLRKNEEKHTASTNKR